MNVFQTGQYFRNFRNQCRLSSVTLFGGYILLYLKCSVLVGKISWHGKRQPLLSIFSTTVDNFYHTATCKHAQKLVVNLFSIVYMPLELRIITTIVIVLRLLSLPWNSYTGLWYFSWKRSYWLKDPVLPIEHCALRFLGGHFFVMLKILRLLFAARIELFYNIDALLPWKPKQQGRRARHSGQY